MVGNRTALSRILLRELDDQVDNWLDLLVCESHGTKHFFFSQFAADSTSSRRLLSLRQQGQTLLWVMAQLVHIRHFWVQG